MKEKFDGMKAFFQEKVDQATQSAKEFVDREDTKAAVAWTKDTLIKAADEAVALGKRAADSEMGKDAATGAAIGAAVAVPIPIIGPVIGAVVGAGAGMVIGHKTATTKRTNETDKKSVLPEIDIHKRLIDLDDLRQKGILSQDEFEEQKKKVLN